MKRLIIKKAFDYKEIENTSRDYCNFIEQNFQNILNSEIDAKQAEQLYQITDRLYNSLEQYKNEVSTKIFRQLNNGSRRMEKEVTKIMELVELIWGLAQMWRDQITKQHGTYKGVPGLQKVTSRQVSIMHEIKSYLKKNFVDVPDMSYLNSPNPSQQDIDYAAIFIMQDLNKLVLPFRSVWDLLTNEGLSDSDYNRITRAWQQVKNQDWQQRYDQLYQRKLDQSNGNITKTNFYKFRWMIFMNDQNFVSQLESKLLEKGIPLFGPEGR